MRTIFSIILISLTVSLSAQNNLGKSDDAGRIAICPVVGNIPDIAARS